MRVLGASAASPEVTGTPLTTRFSKVEPLELLVAPPLVRLLVATAITSLAGIRPFRMLMSATVATLWALAPVVPIAPVVVLLRKADDSVLGTLSASAEAVAMSPSGAVMFGSTASGDLASDP